MCKNASHLQISAAPSSDRRGDGKDQEEGYFPAITCQKHQEETAWIGLQIIKSTKEMFMFQLKRQNDMMNCVKTQAGKAKESEKYVIFAFTWYLNNMKQLSIDLEVSFIFFVNYVVMF